MSVPTATPRRATGMRARVEVATELRAVPAGGERSCVSVLRAEGPLMPRLTMPRGPEPGVARLTDAPRICLAARAAGPVGGDRYHLDVDVGPGSMLVLSDVSSTLLLPGPHGEQSRTDVRIHVAAGGTLIWLPEPLIAARGCDHVNRTRVDLDAGARLLAREEVLLGRHGEESGTVRQHMRVRLRGRSLYAQDLDLGGHLGRTPPVIGGHRAVGSVLVVDPGWAESPPSARRLPAAAAVLPLAGPAALITALGDDNLALRRTLHTGLHALGPDWDTDPAAEPDRHGAREESA